MKLQLYYYNLKGSFYSKKQLLEFSQTLLAYFKIYRLGAFLTTLVFVLLSATGTMAQEVLLGLTSVDGPQGGGTAFTINSSGTNFKVRKGFYSLGISPYGDLTLGKDGNFYGMTANGGNYAYGTIFKMTPAGKVTNLYHFDSPDGTGPAGNLIQGTDGDFYGMTFVNGEYGKGTIFKITPDGIFKVLKSFNAPIDGSSPWGSLVQGRDGNFYGMTWLGGKYNYGTIFKMTPAGVFTVLHSFNGTTNGQSPRGNLVQGKDGNFYGMTPYGGTYGYGTIFKVTPTGTFTVLRALNNATDGGLPDGSLILSTDGNFYGMTYDGGENYNGTIFKITPKGAFTVLRHLSSADGGHPYGSLVRGTDGNFYGMTYNGGDNYYGTIFKLTSSGTFTVLEHLDYTTTGSNPRGSLVQGKDGSFYGMANNGPSRFGTIFKITPNGNFNLLVSLPDNNEGNTPYSGLVQGRDGYYYGTTTQGGKNSGGTIFKMCPDGTYTILHSFSNYTDGSGPQSALIQGSDGNFYGTTSTGGSNGRGYGTIYKITPRGTFTVLYSFDFSTTGRSPHGGLVQGNDGNFYGLTFEGGKDGGGTVYKITPSGTLTTLRELSFNDGADSKATLVKGKDDNFYGMTHIGGNAGGTIFKITPKGAFNVIYNFTNASGGFPRGSLMQDANGNFYGATQSGGSKGYGTIFKLTTSGKFTVLYNFNGTTDGQEPQGSLVRDSKGNLFGVNSKGGTYQGGTIFRLAPDGTFKVLRHLNKSTDGGAPQGSLILQKANPVAKAQSVVTAINTPKTITLSGTGGTPLIFTIVTQPKNGALTGSGANRKYTPKPGFTGSDSFTLTVAWGCQTSAAKTVSITVGEAISSSLMAAADLQPAANLYPNPADQFLTVTFPDAVTRIQAQITDASGFVIKNIEQPLENQKLQIDVSALLPGLYQLHYNTTKGQQMLRFVKR